MPKRIKIFCQLVYGYSWKSAGFAPCLVRPWIASAMLPVAVLDAWEETSTPDLVRDWDRRLNR